MLRGTLNLELPVRGEGKRTPVAIVEREGSLAGRKGGRREGHPHSFTAAATDRGKVGARLRTKLPCPNGVPGRVPGRRCPHIDLGAKRMPDYPARSRVRRLRPARWGDVRAEYVRRGAGKATALRVRGEDACDKRRSQESTRGPRGMEEALTEGSCRLGGRGRGPRDRVCQMRKGRKWDSDSIWGEDRGSALQQACS